MSTDPFSGDVKPIRNVRGLFRRRVGDYRIAFTINFEKGEVIILKASRRGKFY
jgi:mRNA-degrading endonuclease RelE of RelBE toxin-antitoxin system